MQLLTAFSLKNRALIALVTIVAAVFGLIGVGSLKQELMPSVQFPTIAVITSYPGASPEVVNNDVSAPIETALRGVSQLEGTSATSSTGSSVVLAEFAYGVDLAVTEQRVERAISRISQLLPEQADTQVLSGSIDDFPVIQIAVTPAEGESPEQAAPLIERVAISELSDLPGVREAQLTGARTDRVTIQPNAEALAAQGLSEQSIVDTLQQSGVLLAAGTVADGDRTLAVQAGSELGSADEIAALPVPRSAEAIAAEQDAAQEAQPALPGQAPEAEASPAAAVTIGDLAEVRLEPGPQESISRVDGAPALTIAVTKTSAANTVEVSHAVQEKLDELRDQLGGAELTVIFDQAPYVEQSIETLTTEGLLGLVFAVLVILVFLMSVRATLVTAISIPTSVLLTLVGLTFADYTLNLLTLGALTISIGRVVDDSIVVIENIKRHLAAGGDRAATIIEAVREVGGAITASTITTVAVFLPMAFVGGMVGELFRPFALTVTIALLASLLVALTIVPVLAYWFLRPERPRRRRSAAAKGGLAADAGGLPAAGPAASGLPPTGLPAAERPATELPAAEATALQRGYRPVIEWTLRRPAVTLLAAALVFGGTIALTPLLKTNYIGSDGQNSIGLTQTLAPGTSLDAQLAQAERVEEALRSVDEVRTVQVTIGGAGGVTSLFGGGGDGTVSYSITSDPDADQARVQQRIRDAVDGLDDAGEFAIAQSGGGAVASSAIEVDVAAPDQETLREASEAVTEQLRAEPGLQQVESDLGQSRPFLRIAVDRAAAAAAGLTEAAVAGQVQQQMQPRQIGQIVMDADTVAVYLASGVAPEDQAGVAALPIQTVLGPQRLDALAAVEVADGPVNLHTVDGSRTVTVSALPVGVDLGAATAAVRDALAAVELPAGASAEIGGASSQQSEAFQQLGIALLAAILIVYVVMVATFRSLLQPLLLLVSVPFAATGALLLLVATGIPLGVASLIGVLMLVGIVVTNAIVLIDLVNQYRERGEALRDAVVHGSLQRLRPIVMTALATILALTPMALGITGKGGFISQPLAVVVIGGLLSSTVLTLVVLPTLYYAVEHRRERWRERRAGSSRGPGGPGTDGSGGRAAGGPRRRGIRRGSDGGGAGLASAGAVGAVGAATAGAAGTAVMAAAPVPARPARAAEPMPAAEPVPAVEPVPAADHAAVADADHAAVADADPATAGGVAAGADTGIAEDEPELASETEPTREGMGTETARISLALDELGFTGEENPLLAGSPADPHAADPHPADPLSTMLGESDEAARQDGQLAPLVLPEPPGAVPADPAPQHPAGLPEEPGDAEGSAAGETPGAGGDSAERPAGDTAPAAAAQDAIADAAADAGDGAAPQPAATAPAAPPPVTGELDWEQLLWEATQEVDEPERGSRQGAASDPGADAEPGADSEPDAGAGER